MYAHIQNIYVYFFLGGGRGGGGLLFCSCSQMQSTLVKLLFEWKGYTQAGEEGDLRLGGIPVPTVPSVAPYCTFNRSLLPTDI